MFINSVLARGLTLTFLVLACMTVRSVEAMYITNHGPVNFCTEDVARQKQGTDETCKSSIDVYVNRLDSVENAIPYEYDRYDFCQVDKESSSSENLGQVLFGDRIRPSPYKFKFKENGACVKVCSKTYKIDGDKETKEKLNLLKKAVLFNYQHHWIIDNMPVTWCYEVQTDQADGNEQSKYCSPGFPVGCFVDTEGNRKDSCVIDQRYGGKNSYYIFNHVNIDIEYHPIMKEGEAEEDSVARLVRASVVPFSIKQQMKGEEIVSCNPLNDGEGNGLSIPGGSFSQDYMKEISITYSYNVSFTNNPSVFWASRWDNVLDTMPHTQIQWFSIINSLVVAVFLTGGVALMLKNIFKEETSMKAANRNWIYIQGDVFRPPKNEMLLSVFLGSGSQIIIVTFFILFLACTGIFSPASRGLLMTTALILFSCTGIVAGYVSSTVYKGLGGKNMQFNVLLTSFLIPGIVFSEFIFTDLIFWGHESSAAVPFTTIVILLGLWLVVYMPLVFIGSYIGFKQKPVEVDPCPINEIPRAIPKGKILTTVIPGVVIGGILPFGCIFIQLFLILNSIWAHQLYYTYGFLTLVALLLVATCAEGTILLCYFQLQAEDYRWWWRSFLAGGFTAFYFFLYCVNYFFTRLELHGTASKFIYFTYTSVMALLLFLFCGTVSFFSCLLFVMKIYSTIETL